MSVDFEPRRRAWWASSTKTTSDGDTVDGASRYDVQFAVSKDGGSSTHNTRRRSVAARDDDADATAFCEFTEIRRKRHYRGRVRAADAFGRKGAWSGWTSWTQPGGKPGVVQNVVVTNPRPRKVLVRWDPPTDTTDFDFYKVEIYRGVDLVHTGYRLARDFTYEVPPADRGVNHTAKVYAVDAPEAGVEEPSDPTTSGTVADAGTWNSEEVTTSGGPISDGSAPDPAPTPTVADFIGEIWVSWSGVTNNDPVTYEVHLITSAARAGDPGWATGASTKVGETSSTRFIAHQTAAGTDLAYGTDYYCKVVAKDADGAAAASAEAGPVQIAKVDHPDIAADAVRAVHILANNVTAGKLEADLILATIIRTATSGARLEWRADTATKTYDAYDASGVLRVRISSAGKIEVYDASANVVARFDGVDNLLVGTLKNALSGTRWEIVSGGANVVRGYQANLDNPAEILTIESGDQGSLSLTPPHDTGDPGAQLTIESRIAGALSPAGVYNYQGEEHEARPGTQGRGYCSVQAYNDNASARSFGHGVTYGGLTALRNTPSSISFTTVGTDSGSPTNIAAQDINIRGFRFKIDVAATSTGKASRTYVTVGN